MDTAMEEALRALARSAQTWSTVTGILRGGEDAELIDWLHDSASSSTPRSYPGSEGKTDFSDVPPTSEYAYRFWATAQPWRLRIDGREELVSPPTQDVTVRSVRIVDGRRWWVIHGDEVEAGVSAPATVPTAQLFSLPSRLDTGVGAHGPSWTDPGLDRLDVLLAPEHLTAAFRFHHAAQCELAGRRAVILEGRHDSEDGFVAAFRRTNGLFVWGADEYALTVDLDSGIVLAWEARSYSHPVEWQYLYDVSVDSPVSLDLFARPRSATEPSSSES